MKKIAVQKFNKVQIHLEDGTFKAEYAGLSFARSTLADLLRDLSDSSIKEESGNYFTVSYDGIRKARALRSYVDKYSGKDYVVVEEYDQYGNKREEQVERKRLLPATEKLQEAYKKQEEMVKEGWAMIHKGQELWRKAVDTLPPTGGKE